MEVKLPPVTSLKHRSVSLQEKPLPQLSSSPKITNLFVQEKKVRHSSKARGDIGFEYDHDVQNDYDYYGKIYSQNCYNPGIEYLPDCDPEIQRLMEGAEGQDKGTIMKATVLSLFVLFGFSFAIGEGIAGGGVAGPLGKYAAKKLRKKVKSKQHVIHEELYVTKLKCLIKLGKLQSGLLKHNLNKFRTIVEKIIEESTLAFRFSLFENRSKVITAVLKLRTFLLTVQSQKALLLSYKLFKIHFKQIDMEDPQSVQEIADKLNRIYIPYAKLMEIDAKTDGKTLKKLTNVVTYKKIKKLMLRPEIIHVLKSCPDPRLNSMYIERFRVFLREKTDLEAKFNNAEMRLPDKISYLKSLSFDRHYQHHQPIIKLQPAVKRPLEIKVPGSDWLELSENLSPDEADEQETIDMKADIRTLQTPKSRMAGESFSFTDSSMKQYNPNKQVISKTVHPKTPFSVYIDAGRQQDGDDSNESSDDDSSEKGKQDQEGGEERLEDDSALYEEDEPIEDIMAKPKVKMNITPPKKFDCSKADNDMWDGSPIKINRSPGLKKSEPISLNNLDAEPEIMKSASRTEHIRRNTYVNFEQKRENEDNEQGNNQALVGYNQVYQNTIMRNLSESSEANRQSHNHGRTKKEMTFQKILAIAYDEQSKWDKVCSNQIIRIHKIKPEDSPVMLLRAWAFLEGITPKEVFDHIYDTTARARWDNVLTDLQVVEKIDYETEIIYFYVKTPLGITERDFVQKRQFQLDYPEKGQILMSFQSVTHPAKPPTKSRIRAETHIAGYVIKPSEKDPNSTEMCILSQVDIKGNIPKVIVNMVSGRAPADWVNKLKKACEVDRKKY